MQLLQNLVNKCCGGKPKWTTSNLPLSNLVTYDQSDELPMEEFAKLGFFQRHRQISNSCLCETPAGASRYWDRFRQIRSFDMKSVPQISGKLFDLESSNFTRTSRQT